MDLSVRLLLSRRRVENLSLFGIIDRVLGLRWAGQPFISFRLLFHQFLVPIFIESSTLDSWLRNNVLFV